MAARVSKRAPGIPDERVVSIETTPHTIARRSLDSTRAARDAGGLMTRSCVRFEPSGRVPAAGRDRAISAR